MCFCRLVGDHFRVFSWDNVAVLVNDMNKRKVCMPNE